MCIMLAPETEDDVEMSEDFYNHYLVAPVVTCIGNEELAEPIKKFGDHIHFITVSSEDEAEKAMVEAFEHCKTKYASILEKDVKPAFAKFDKDNSGAIDKEELN